MTVEGGLVDTEGKLLTGMRKGQPRQWTSSVHCFVDTLQVRWSAAGACSICCGVAHLRKIRATRRCRHGAPRTPTYALQTEGVVKGLWRGVGPTMSRAALLSAGQLSSYDHSKTLLLRAGWLDDGKTLHIVAAIISGIVATVCCNPGGAFHTRHAKHNTLVCPATKRNTRRNTPSSSAPRRSTHSPAALPGCSHRVY